MAYRFGFSILIEKNLPVALSFGNCSEAVISYVSAKRSRLISQRSRPLRKPAVNVASPMARYCMFGSSSMCIEGESEVCQWENYGEEV